jgi:hypothetical protein
MSDEQCDSARVQRLITDHCNVASFLRSHWLLVNQPTAKTPWFVITKAPTSGLCSTPHSRASEWNELRSTSLTLFTDRTYLHNWLTASTVPTTVPSLDGMVGSRLASLIAIGHVLLSILVPSVTYSSSTFSMEWPTSGPLQNIPASRAQEHERWRELSYQRLVSNITEAVVFATTVHCKMSGQQDRATSASVGVGHKRSSSTSTNISGTTTSSYHSEYDRASESKDILDNTNVKESDISHLLIEPSVIMTLLDINNDYIRRFCDAHLSTTKPEPSTENEDDHRIDDNNNNNTISEKDMSPLSLLSVQYLLQLLSSYLKTNDKDIDDDNRLMNCLIRTLGSVDTCVTDQCRSICDHHHIDNLWSFTWPNLPLQLNSSAASAHRPYQVIRYHGHEAVEWLLQLDIIRSYGETGESFPELVSGSRSFLFSYLS